MIQTDRPFVLLDDNLSHNGECLLFENPEAVVSCQDPDQVDDALAFIDRATHDGLWAAGFLSYELGYLLEPRLVPLLPKRRYAPLLWFGLFRQPERLDPRAVPHVLGHRGEARVEQMGLSTDRGAYGSAFARVMAHIRAGDVYQINLTFKQGLQVTGPPPTLYLDLRRKQRVAHGALIRTPDQWILSLSPELFIRADNDQIVTRPMKGTAPRGLSREQDDELRAWLQSDGKSRAENLMIVDLLRNDLGRIACPGTVAVDDLFCVETYPSVLQMTSQISARLPPEKSFPRLVASLFPCGSITGAPKIRAMEIIRDLEPEPRGVYTGAIGMVAPGGDLRFNVAIRTVVLDEDGRGEMGIGSGLVADSDLNDEWQECLLKGRFLTDPLPDFELIETLRWEPDSDYFLLERHLQRLAASAARFGFRFNEHEVRRRLADTAEHLDGRAHRVRLLLHHDGAVEVSTAHIQPDDGGGWTYTVSDRLVRSDNPYVYHKTTMRQLLDGELARLRSQTGCDEVLFLNEHGELTEGSRSNIFIERDGVLLTPPVHTGLLNGCLRQHLIADPGRQVTEAVLTPSDLDSADNVFLGNSVRGLVRAKPARPLRDPGGSVRG